MFGIGFSEILLVAVVALIVIGPKELPAVVRNVAHWVARARQFTTVVKTEFQREISKAEEVGQHMKEQLEIVERHSILDPTKPTVPVQAVPPAPPPADAITPPITNVPTPVITGDGLPR